MVHVAASRAIRWRRYNSIQEVVTCHVLHTITLAVHRDTHHSKLNEGRHPMLELVILAMTGGIIVAVSVVIWWFVGRFE